MSKTVVFRRIAQAELNEAAAWYEAQRQGLGPSFLTEVQRSLEVMAAHPERAPFALADVCSLMIRKFLLSGQADSDCGHRRLPHRP